MGGPEPAEDSKPLKNSFRTAADPRGLASHPKHFFNGLIANAAQRSFFSSLSRA
jgi:hypothetical protein